MMLAVVKSPPPKAENLMRHRFDPWVRKVPWRRAQQPTPVLMPGESHGQGAWQATVCKVAKSQT